MDLSSALHAGTVFTVTCEVELVSEVDTPVNISIEWAGPDGVTPNADNIAVKDATTNVTITTSSLQFSPLRTSDGGQYTCTGSVKTGSVDLDVKNSNSSVVNVTSTFFPVFCSVIRV